MATGNRRTGNKRTCNRRTGNRRTSFFLYKLFISFYIIKYNMRHTINTICRLLVGPLCEAGVARIVIWAMTVSPAKHADRYIDDGGA